MEAFGGEDCCLGGRILDRVDVRSIYLQSGRHFLPVSPRLQLLLGRSVLTRAFCFRSASGSICFTPLVVPAALEMLELSSALLLDSCVLIPSPKKVNTIRFALMLLRVGFDFCGMTVAGFFGFLEFLLAVVFLLDKFEALFLVPSLLWGGLCDLDCDD